MLEKSFYLLLLILPFVVSIIKQATSCNDERDWRRKFETSSRFKRKNFLSKLLYALNVEEYTHRANALTSTDYKSRFVWYNWISYLAVLCLIVFAALVVIYEKTPEFIKEFRRLFQWR